MLKGSLTLEELEKIKRYLINPVESREAALSQPKTLQTDYAIPTEVAVLDGFTELDSTGLQKLIAENEMCIRDRCMPLELVKWVFTAPSSCAFLFIISLK